MKTSNYSTALVFGKIFYRGFYGFHGWEPRCFLSVPPVPSVVEFLWLRLILCLFLGLTGYSGHAQIQQAWVARYNNGTTNGTNQAVKMALDSAGDIYVTGFSENANSNLGYVTIKYAPNGNQLWATRYDSTNYPSATPAALALDGSNDVLVTGSALTVKYDPNGNQLWTAPYGGTALAMDSDGNPVVAGFGSGFSTVKISARGTNLWSATYNAPLGPAQSQVVLVGSDNNIYVVGSDTYFNFRGYVYEQLLVVKYDSNGNQLWTAANNQGNAPSTSVQIGGAALDGANNLYLVADFDPVVTYVTFMYNADGSVLWTAYPNNNGYSLAHALALDQIHSILMTGQIPSNFLPNYNPLFSYGTIKLATNGSTLWTSLYPASATSTNVGNSLVLDQNGNSYVTGCSMGTNSGNDIVTIKYGPNGNQVWLQRYHGLGNGNNAGNAIAVDNNGNVYVTGYDTTAAGGTEMVTIKYSPVTLQRRSDGTVLLQAQGLAGESFDFQGSTDLMNWLDLGSVLADSNGVAQFQDTNASNYNWRFYITSPQ